MSKYTWDELRTMTGMLVNTASPLTSKNLIRISDVWEDDGVVIVDDGFSGPIALDPEKILSCPTFEFLVGKPLFELIRR